MRSFHRDSFEHKNVPNATTTGPQFGSRAIVTLVAMVAVATLSLGMVTAGPAVAASPSSALAPTAPIVPPRPTAPAPVGNVPGSSSPAKQTPTSAPVAAARIESWTPTSHSLTTDGKTTLDLFAQPAFKRGVDGWTTIDSTITAGQENTRSKHSGW